MNHFLLLLTGHWLLATGTLETPSHFAFDKNQQYHYKENNIHCKQQQHVRERSFCIDTGIASVKGKLREGIPVRCAFVGSEPLSRFKYLFVIEIVNDCASVTLNRTEKVLSAF